MNGEMEVAQQTQIAEAIRQQLAMLSSQDDMKMSLADKRRARFLQTVSNTYDFMYVQSAMSVYYKERSSLSDNYKLLTDYLGGQLVVSVLGNFIRI